ncbi:hypothetical protein N7465_000026 [Penicillium sp. CMV-2018d]|nr:hypothetical protein N7465_000026 [Penicillium sp. CMV-2018d]
MLVFWEKKKTIIWRGVGHGESRIAGWYPSPGTDPCLIAPAKSVRSNRHLVQPRTDRPLYRRPTSGFQGGGGDKVDGQPLPWDDP